MRLNINLATRPYQDIRRYVLRWGAPLLLFAVASALFCWYALHTWNHSKDVNAAIDRVRGEIKTLDQERASAEALLSRPENRVLVEQSRQLNELIARKSFSWTSVFMQLENLMPSQLQVVQITPELNQQNQLELRLVVSGNNREQAVELVRRLEKSPYFTRAELREEKSTKDGVQFDIVALYIPRAAESVSAADQTTGDTKDQSTSAAPLSTAANQNGKAAH